MTGPVKLIAALAAFLLVSPAAFPQGGSTGGSIGKQRKSVSGGEETVPPPRPAPPKRAEREKRPSSESRISVAGRWRWTADCRSGHWHGEFDLAETQGRVSGGFAGTTWYDTGSITDGAFKGNTVTFTRRSSVTQYWTGRVTGGHMAGTLSGNENCSWTAHKK